ncbi:MAG: PEP-CTERM sorting domain-containing protein [Sedimentisphaerales bacterium]|nr:PEP-CTERM sorting domain-containing protein [Sedimentisphaerales bacterium]
MKGREEAMVAKRVIAVLLVITSYSFAGIVPGTFNCTFPDDPNGMLHEWNFDYDTDTLTLAEHIPALGEDSVFMSADTDSDPTIHITKTVTNESGYTWTAYTLDLDGSYGSTFVGTPSSDVFGSAVIEPGNLQITFSSPAPVLPGMSVDLDFDINILSTEGFNICITQNPIPEPLTLALLGLGAAFIRRR